MNESGKIDRAKERVREKGGRKRKLDSVGQLARDNSISVPASLNQEEFRIT